MALQSMEQVLHELTVALGAINPTQVAQLEEMLMHTEEIFLCGLGRSGLCCNGFAMRLMHLGMRSSIVGDVLTKPIQANDLLVITSASGSGKALEARAQKAKALGAKIALITSNSCTPLAGLADLLIEIKAPTKCDCGTERASMLPMGSLFEETAFLLFDLITADLMAAMQITNADMVSRHANLE